MLKDNYKIKNNSLIFTGVLLFFFQAGTLASLARLLHDRELDLPDGTRLRPLLSP